MSNPVYAPVGGVESEDDAKNHRGEVLQPTVRLSPSSSHLPEGFPGQTAPLKRRNRRKRLSWLQYWWLEITACIFAIGALLAIWATLHVFSGTTFPQLPIAISLNSLLSIYVQILQGAVLLAVTSGIGQLQWTWFSSNRPLYDAVRYNGVSQGPLGSAVWLWTYQFRQPLTALGALIVILAIGINPFVQQLAKPVSCSIVVDSLTANMPLANYIGGNLDTTILINQAIPTPPTKVANLTQCSTGNCTFSEPYHSLGYCVSCKDLSAKVQFGITCLSGPKKTVADPSDCPDLSSVNISSTLNGDTQMITTFNSKSLKLQLLEIQAVQVEDLNFVFQVLQGKTAAKPGTPIFDPASTPGGMVYPDCSISTNADNWLCQGYGAASCSVLPCIRTYNATVENSQITETEVADPVMIQPSVGADVPGLVNTQCISDSQADSLRQMGYTWGSDTVWLNVHFTGDKSDDVLFALQDAGCLFSVEEGSDLFWPKDFFDGLVTGGGDSLVEGVFTVDGPIDGPALHNYIWNYGSTSVARIQDIFLNISDTLTWNLRAQSSIPPATGQVLHYAVCIQVSWVWIAYPAAFVFLALVFLALVIATAGMGSTTPVWKGSPLAWIFCGPGSRDWTELREQGDDGSADWMADAAKGLDVALVPGPYPAVRFVDSTT